MDLLIWRSINLFRERSSILRDRGGFENRTLPDPEESYALELGSAEMESGISMRERVIKLDKN